MAKELLSSEKVKDRDVASVAEAERAATEVKAQIFLARENPRNAQRAMTEMERTAGIPEFAATAFYSYPRAKTEIFGPSINLARELVRLWGNVINKMAIIHSDPEGDKIIMEVFAWDLETNYSVSRQAEIKMLIQRKFFQNDVEITKWIKPDERDRRELIERHHSLLKRNCILELFPRWWVDKLVQISREAVKRSIKGKKVPDIRQSILVEFDKMGVYREQLEKFLGHPFDQTTNDELVELQGIIRSIRDGVASKQEWFGNGKKPETQEQQQEERPSMDLKTVLEGAVVSEGPKEKYEEKEEMGLSKKYDGFSIGDERIFDEFKDRMDKMTTAKEVSDYFREIRSQKQAMRLSEALLGKMTTIVNDTLRRLTKK